MARHLGLALACLLVTGLAPPALAQEAEQVGGYHRRLELVPAEGHVLVWDGRRFGGRLEVKVSQGGLAVVEHLPPEQYLMGIEEVPLTWPEAALRAQAVAARTYLAWTLAGGRAGAAASHGFDICATDACQVYRGLDQLDRSGGARWAAAIGDTADQVLVYQGRPAQALYSSTSGGRTRAVQDVFEGSPPIPYLQAVDSPGEDSPFASWQVELASWKLADVLREADYLVGPDVSEAAVLETVDGGGPWQVRLMTGAGERLIELDDFRRLMNRYGPRRHPGELPAQRPDGKRYPQVILSYTFSIHEEVRIPDEFRPGYPLRERVFVIEGAGWGHQVGMSQYGAKAMADRGAGYGEILAHFYGGLQPQQAGDLLPDEVSVGLDWGREEVRISSDGPVTLLADGEPLVTGALGEWTFRSEEDLVAVIAPEGFGLPPTLGGLEAVSPVQEGRAVVLRGVLSTPSELRVVVFRGPEVVATTEWTVKEAGPVVLLWDASVDGRPAGPGIYQVLVQGRSPSGNFAVFTTLEVIP